VFGVFLLAVAIPDEDRVYYQEIGVVITHDSLLTVRKTPPGGRPPYDMSAVREAIRPDDSAGLIVYRLVDDLGERYLDLVHDQNEVMKRLTVIASLLLLPTFIVGLYGQNFVNIPELRWQFGYAYVWGVIVLTTFGQLWFFKKKNWF